MTGHHFTIASWQDPAVYIAPVLAPLLLLNRQKSLKEGRRRERCNSRIDNSNCSICLFYPNHHCTDSSRQTHLSYFLPESNTGWTVVGWIAGVIWAVAAHPLPKRGPAGSKPLEVDTWSFGSLKLSDRRQIEQAERWVLG
jgi:hypothetical protein